MKNLNGEDTVNKNVHRQRQLYCGQQEKIYTRVLYQRKEDLSTMAKHTRDELKQMQALPLNIKIKMTQQRIRDWYNYWGGNVYQSFSGGKDSTVMKHIVDSMGYDVPAVFVNTGLEYPEIQQFVRDIKDGKYDCFNDNVEIIRPKMRFDEVVKNIGYPVISKTISHIIAIAKRTPNGKIAKKYVFDENSKSKYSAYRYRMLVNAPFNVSDRCCDIMKKKPFHEYEKETGRKSYTATMADESMNRETNWLQNGCNAFETEHPQSKPLSFWTEQDILSYLKTYNVPYASVYGDIVTVNNQLTLFGDKNYELETTGCDRTGCIFCGFGCHLDKGKSRFERLKETHPRQYNYCLNGGEYDENGIWKPNKQGLGMKHVFDELNKLYGDDFIRY